MGNKQQKAEIVQPTERTNLVSPNVKKYSVDFVVVEKKKITCPRCDGNVTPITGSTGAHACLSSCGYVWHPKLGPYPEDMVKPNK